jgi:hypothetical protein
VGAFLAFTLSQAGMVIHWRRAVQSNTRRSETSGATRDAKSNVRLWVNGVGAVATGAALVIILTAKFVEGAWITVLAVPAILIVFRLVHRYYANLNAQTCADGPLDLSHNQTPVVLVPTKGWNKLSGKALRFAMWISNDLIAVHLSNLSGEEAQEEEQRLSRQWANDVEAPAKLHGSPVPKLVVVQSPYRNFLPPLLQVIQKIEDDYPLRQIAVVVPEVVETRWWQLLLHRRKAARLRSAILKRGDQRVIIINVPWYLEG